MSRTLEQAISQIENSNGLSEKDKKSLIKALKKAKENTKSYTEQLNELSRELEIESALERIRQQALAMRSSDDLLEVSTVLREQMGKLGQTELESAIVHIYPENADALEAWYVFRAPDDPDGKFVRGKAIAPYASSWYTKETIKKYHSSEQEYTIVSNKKRLIEWYDVLERIAPDTVDYDNHGNKIIPEVLNYHYSKFSGGALLMISTEQPSEEAIELQGRAAQVFNLAFRRFLDLQKAEAQAKDAIKQASLDRVRGEIASMRSPEDLQRITPLIFNELKTLGVPFIRCGVFIMDEQLQIVTAYLSSPEGKALGELKLPFDDNPLTAESLGYWYDNKIYHKHWDKEDFISWTAFLKEKGYINDLSTFQGSETPPESIELQYIPFEQGMLYVGSSDPLTAYQLELSEALAGVFSVAYARYEDFIKLEKAKVSIENTLTELRTTQNQLIQSEKMASLGELTAGIAHEIKNPLNFVNNFSEVSKELLEEMMEEMLKGDKDEAKDIAKDIVQNLDKIVYHGKRADDIVKGMLQHSRKGDGQKELADINKLCDEYLRLAYHGLRAKDKSFNAKMETDFDNSLSQISIIPQDIGRVVLNLLTNAFYAVSNKANNDRNAKYEPTVVIKTRKQNSAVEIIVTDNGDGIPDSIKNKIFEPFFTTKPTGQGTGLGLSMSYDIITKGHEGELEMKSSGGKGTTFTIKLPQT